MNRKPDIASDGPDPLAGIQRVFSKREVLDRGLAKLGEARASGKSSVVLSRREILEVLVSRDAGMAQSPVADPFRVAATVLAGPSGPTGFFIHGVEVRIARDTRDAGSAGHEKP